VAGRVPVHLPPQPCGLRFLDQRGASGGTQADGFAVQGWGRVPLLGDRLSVGVGGGHLPIFRHAAFAGGEHENVHGWAPVYSLTATYYTETPWFAQVAVNHIHPESDTNSNTYLVGVGYRLWKEGDSASGPGMVDRPANTTGYEVMPFLGQVVVNRPGNDTGIGSGFEFRMGIDEHLDWTVTWLNEDVPSTFHRTGLGSQIWLVDAFLARRLTLGFGRGCTPLSTANRCRTPGKRAPGHRWPGDGHVQLPFLGSMVHPVPLEPGDEQRQPRHRHLPPGIRIQVGEVNRLTIAGDQGMAPRHPTATGNVVIVEGNGGIASTWRLYG